MKKPNFHFVDIVSVADKIIYWTLTAIFYPIKYLTLLPHFCMKRSFMKGPNVENSSVCISENKGEKIFRNVECVNNLTTGYKNCKSISEILKNVASENPHKNLLGTRKIIRQVDYVEQITDRKFKQLELGPYEWKTADDVLKLVNQYAYGLLSIDITNNGKTKVAIFADNCEEWFISSQALLASGIPIVTVYPNLTDDGILHALNSTKVSTIILDDKSFNRFNKLSNECIFLKNLILLSSCEDIDISNLLNQFSCYTINDLYEKGNEFINSNQNITFSSTEDDEIALIMFTSGSSGHSKGVLLSHKNLLTQVGSEINKKEDWENHTYIALLPCAHILEFIVELSIIAYGGCLGYSSTLTLTNKSPMIIPGTEGDLRALKPTLAIFVPILLDRVTKHVLRIFNSEKRWKQILIQFLIEYKTFNKLAYILGGNLKLTLSAGAPLSYELSLFCNSVFCMNLKQGYGTTETCCAGSLGRVTEPYSFDTGVITASCDIKIVDWEEGSYFTTDEPYPRGEIYIGGDSVAMGYFEDDEQTIEAFEVDENNKRWFKTGDIGQILPSGNLQIIDRKKDIIKLRHGEYVSLGRIECSLMKSRFADSICVCPNLDSSYLICIIVPNRPQIIELLKAENKQINEDFSVHILDSSVRKAMLQDIDTLSKFDRPEKFHFVTEIWTPENGFMTPSMKLKRSVIYKYYSHFIE